MLSAYLTRVLTINRTEAGPVIRAAIAYESRPAEWEYFRFLSPDLATIEMIPHGEHDGFMEPVILVSVIRVSTPRTNVHITTGG